jgi:hypothetical protein
MFVFGIDTLPPTFNSLLAISPMRAFDGKFNKVLCANAIKNLKGIVFLSATEIFLKPRDWDIRINWHCCFLFPVFLLLV